MAVSGEEGAALVVAVLGGGGLGAVVVKWLSRPVDEATAAKIRAEVQRTAQQTAAGEVDTLREIIAEVRASEAKKTERIDSLEARLEKLEERERNALTRAAVHEVWDRLAFNFITGRDQTFPPPPPLSERSLPSADH